MCRSWRTTHEFFTTCGPHDRAQAIRLAQKCPLAQLAILLALFNFFDLPYRVMGFIIALVVFCLFCILRQKVWLYNLTVLELTMEMRLAWHSHRSACLCLLNAAIRHVLPSQRPLSYTMQYFVLTIPLAAFLYHMSHYLIGNHSCPWFVSSDSLSCLVTLLKLGF